MFKFINAVIAGLLISSSAFASGGHERHGEGYYGERHHGHGNGYGYYGDGHHRHGHGHHYQNYGPVYYAPPPPPQIIREEVYYPQPVIQRPAEVRYYPETVIYEQAPAPVYQSAPPSYNVDRRNPAGLVGGALGSVLGYEAGRGDPLAAGIGAAAGSLLGNSLRR